MPAADERTLRLYRAQDDYLFAGAGASPIHDYPTAQWLATALVGHEGFARRWPDAHRLLALPDGARYARYEPPGAWLPTMPDGSLCEQGVCYMAHTEPTLGAAWGTQCITLDLRRGVTEGIVVHELAHLVTTIELGEDHDEHGVEFAQNMLVLAEWAHGRAAAAQLREALRAVGLLSRKPLAALDAPLGGRRREIGP